MHKGLAGFLGGAELRLDTRAWTQLVAKRNGSDLMIGYSTFGTNDIERAKAFYDAVLAPLGGRQVMPMAGGVIYGGGEGAAFGITAPFDGQPASAGNGAMVALRARDAATVQAVYDKAIALGATCEGPPGERGAGRQAAYFRDLDGNKLCVFAMG